MSSTSIPAAEQPHAPDAAAPAPVAATSASQRWQSALVFGVNAVVGVLAVLDAWRLPPFGKTFVSTENALVGGEVTITGTQLSGYVEQVALQDFQIVNRGDVLTLIGVRTYADRRAQAAAHLAEQEALLANWTQQRHNAEQSIVLAQSALDIARHRRAGGYASYLEELDAQRTLYSAQVGLPVLKSRALIATVGLYHAMGGGWTADSAGSRP